MQAQADKNMNTHQLTNISDVRQENKASNAAHQTASSTLRSRRAATLQWLRKMHGWIGLWGAAIFLLFGSTAILLNHRALLKIPAAQSQESTVQLRLPQPVPADARAMADWLQRELALDRAPGKLYSEPSRPVAWGDKPIVQPEHWTATFASPRATIVMDYWLGNNFVSIQRNENKLFLTLNNLHKASGVGIGWILFADSLAGSLILLSFTGVAMWAMINRRRMIGTGIAAVSIGLAILFAMQAM
jgi:hypothetical protein